MRFLGFRRVRNYLTKGRDFRNSDIYHVAAVFTEKKKGNEYTLIIPTTSLYRKELKTPVVLSDSGKLLAIKTPTIQRPEHKAFIIPEVIIKKGRFDSRGFRFLAKKDFEMASKAIFDTLIDGKYEVHSNQSVNQPFERDVELCLMKKMADAVKRFWVGSAEETA